ncbi:MAG: hypothetical protein AB1634_01100 [Thermodesulfobacteriota bacterium]
MMRLTALVMACCLVSGCAQLGQSGLAVTSREAVGVRKIFMQTMEANRQCLASFDTGVEVTWDSVFQSGRAEGYLQTMTPAFVKFVAIGPLDQPLAMFFTDGRDFRYIAVPEGRGYQGSVQASAFRRFAPSGLAAHELVYWLTGRLPPGDLQMQEVRRHDSRASYWMIFTIDGLAGRHQVLFDPKSGQIIRHRAEDNGGAFILEAVYGGWQQDGGCWVPRNLSFSLPTGQGSLFVRFSDWRLQAALAPDDFVVDIPQGFEEIEVR